MIADISLGDLIWGLIVFFFMVMYLMVVFSVVLDLFRDDETSGWLKAAWIVFILVLPLISVIAYLGFRGHGMGARAARSVRRQNETLDAQMRASWPSAVDQIARAKELLDSGAIDQAEFDQLKAQALERSVAGT